MYLQYLWHFLQALYEPGCWVHSRFLISIFILMNNFWSFSHRNGMLCRDLQVSMAMLFPPYIAPSWFNSHGSYQGPICSKCMVSDGMEMHS